MSLLAPQVAFQLFPPAMASASSHAALPVSSQGAKQSDEPCYKNFKLATYNIGAKQEEAFQGTFRLEFLEKLAEDIKSLINDGIHVLCLQEMSRNWEERIIMMILPEGWKTTCASNCMIAYHGPSWKTIEQSNHLVFPDDAKNVYRCWRSYLRITLEAKDETKFIIGNLHVVSGSAITKVRDIITENHAIPGKTKEKREQFKQKCLQTVLEHMLTAGHKEDPAAPQGPLKDKIVLVLAGDFNLLPDSFRQAMKEATSKEIKDMCAVGLSSNKGKAGQRDWIICNKPIAAPDEATIITAWDKAHAAIIGEWSAMSEHAARTAEAAAAQRQYKFSSESIAARVIQRVVMLRARLHLRMAERRAENAEAQRAEEEKMQAAAEQAAAEQQSGKRQRKEETEEACGRCRCRRRF
jgi:hypothetical protein